MYAQHEPVWLGHVDGFHQDHNARKTNDGFEAGLGLFASKRHPFEALQFPDHLFDASTGFV